MKITGTSSYVQFDLENGYLIRADGELGTRRKPCDQFLAYKDSMKIWQAPAGGEQELSAEMADAVIRMVRKMNRKAAVRIVFI